ncbi:MAG: hypothetical protein GY810_07100 [Aureispira sp.]|nr:hypothetical protein [Aureispira sp.]
MKAQTLEQLKPLYTQAVSNYKDFVEKAAKDYVITAQETQKLVELDKKMQLLKVAIKNMSKVRKMSVSVKKTGNKFWSEINNQANDNAALYKKEYKDASTFNGMKSYLL